MLEKKSLNPLTTLTMFIHVIFHLLCSLPGYLGVMIHYMHMFPLYCTYGKGI